MSIIVAAGIVAIIDQQHPVQWGTFTESYCEPSRRGCQSIGTWTSDDGKTTKVNIELDGWVEPGGSIRAGYRAGGIMTDDVNNIVHAGVLSHAAVPLWFVMAAGTASYALFALGYLRPLFGRIDRFLRRLVPARGRPRQP